MSLLGGIISGVGGLLGLAGSKSAAKEQRRAADQASDLQRYMFDQNREDQAPWRNAGLSGLEALLFGLGLEDKRSADPASMRTRENFDSQSYARANPDAVGYVQSGAGDYFDHWTEDGMRRDFQFTQDAQRRMQEAQASPARDKAGFGDLLRDFRASDFQEDPGHQFRLSQGEGAINRNALARGRYNSGSTLKALQGFNSDLASQEYGNAFNRFRAQQGDRFNRLAGFAGIGQSAANQVNTDRMATGNALASNIIGAGNAAAAGRVGGINAITGAIGQGLNWYQGQQALNQLGRQPMPSYRGQPWGGTQDDSWYG